MVRLRYVIFAIAALAIGLWTANMMPAQSPTAQPAQKLTADQQKQLDQLHQLEEQLQKDRDAVHAAIGQYGWDSDQVDTAQEQLVRDRTEYRKLRRSLRAAGVPVSPPSGFASDSGGPRPRAGRWANSYGPGGRRHYRGHGCNCPCGRW